MGGILGGLFGGSGNTEAERGQLEALRHASQSFQAYRPEAMQARLNALANISTAYQGANNALQTMYGGRATPAAAPSAPPPPAFFGAFRPGGGR